MNILKNCEGRVVEDYETGQEPAVVKEGGCIVVLDRDEWAAFCAAVEVAFDDVGAVPEELQMAADRLWEATHGGAA